MSTTAITTITKMLEPLPETVQERVVDHLREYLLDVDEERKWDERFADSQPQLIAAAQRARQQIAEGLAKPMDLDQL